jgi:hypothetical protein
VVENIALFDIAQEIAADHRRGQQTPQIFPIHRNLDVKMFCGQVPQQTNNIAFHDLPGFGTTGTGEFFHHLRREGLDIFPQAIGF